MPEESGNFDDTYKTNLEFLKKTRKELNRYKKRSNEAEKENYERLKKQEKELLDYLEEYKKLNGIK